MKKLIILILLGCTGAVLAALSAQTPAAVKKEQKPAPIIETAEKKEAPATDQEPDDENDAPADRKKDAAKDKEADTLQVDQKDKKGESDDDELEEKKARFKLRGQAKTLYTFHRTNNYMDHDPTTTCSKNLSAGLIRLRLSPEFNYKTLFYAVADIDNEMVFSSYNTSRDFDLYWRPSQFNDFAKTSWDIVHNPNVYYRAKIHRAYVKLSVKHFTATLGRQQIRFGSGRLWNPLDILNPLSPTFVEGADEQKGTDALRLDFFPDDTTEISLVYNPKRFNDQFTTMTYDNQNYIARVKTAVSDFEFAILGGYINSRWVAGLDGTAVVLKGMLRASMLCSQTSGENLYFQANGGYEYTFKNGIYLLVEYFFNQNSLNYNRELTWKDTNNYYKFKNYGGTLGRGYRINDLKAEAVSSTQVGYHQIKMTRYYKYILGYNPVKGDIYWDNYRPVANKPLTVNQHYGGVALGYDFHALVRGDFFLMGDIQGRGIFFTPTIRYNAYQNLDLSAGLMMAYVFNNKASDFKEFTKNYQYFASASYSF